MVAMVAGTFHLFHASKRIWRTRTLSRSEARAAFQCMYSRIYCFTRMPNRAAARLKTRLRNHKALIQRTVKSGTNSSEGRGGALDDEFTKPADNVKLSSCTEMRRRVSIEPMPVSSCSC